MKTIRNSVSAQNSSSEVKGAMKRLRFALPFVAVVALVAMGCGGSFIGGNTSNQLLGTWALTSMTINGTTTACPGTAVVSATTSISCAAYTDTFNSDGSLVRKTSDGTATVNGSFTYNGAVLTTAIGSEDHQDPVSVGSGTGTFVTTQNIFGYTVSYTFVRSSAAAIATPKIPAPATK